MGVGNSGFFWTKCVGGRNFVIFGGRSESGAGSSRLFVHEVRDGQALQDIWSSMFVAESSVF